MICKHGGRWFCSGADISALALCLVVVACWPVPDSHMPSKKPLAHCTSPVHSGNREQAACLGYSSVFPSLLRRTTTRITTPHFLVGVEQHLPSTLRLRGGRKNAKPDAPSQTRRIKKKKEKRKASRESIRSTIKAEDSAQPVKHEGHGWIHPTRIASNKPISALREEFNVPVKDKKKIAADFGHYPSKKNFMPKAMRRALRKKDSAILTKEEKAEDWQRRNLAKQPTPVQPPGPPELKKSSKKKRKWEETEQEPPAGAQEEDPPIAPDDMDMYLQDGASLSGEEIADDNVFGTLRRASREAKMMKQRSLLSVEGRESRLASFARDPWPHIGPKKFLATPERLAAAGFRAEPDAQSMDRTILEYTGEVFADWAPNDDPFVIAGQTLEEAYDKIPGADKRGQRNMARQLVYVYKELGNTERAQVWDAEARLQDAAQSDQQGQKKKVKAAPGETQEGDDGKAEGAAEHTGNAALKHSCMLDTKDGEKVALADVETWRERREQLQQVRKPTPPPWTEFVDSEEEGGIDGIKTREGQEQEGSPAHATTASQAQETSSMQGKQSISQAAKHQDNAALSKAKKIQGKADGPRQRKTLRVEGVRLSDDGKTIIFNETYTLPAPTGKVCFDAISDIGEPYDGLKWTPDKTTCVRTKDIHVSPMITWATDLLSGATTDDVSTWAVRVARQTGRWFIGCATRPFHPAYGVAIDLCSDGCVLGNHGAVYKVRETAAADDRMSRPDLRYQDLAKLHRESITPECKRQVGYPPNYRGVFAFGTDSIVIMTHNKTAETLNVTIVRAALLEGTHGTGVNNDGVPIGVLENVVPPFIVRDVPRKAVPFVNMENVGDGASLLGAEDLMQELHWMLYPDPNSPRELAREPYYGQKKDKKHSAVGGTPPNANGHRMNISMSKSAWQSKWVKAGSIQSEYKKDRPNGVKKNGPRVIRPFSKAKPDEVIGKRMMEEKLERLRENIKAGITYVDTMLSTPPFPFPLCVHVCMFAVPFSLALLVRSIKVYCQCSNEALQFSFATF
jgi:hypothetical protein